MKLHFPHATFTLEDLFNGKINQKKFTQSESYVFNFIKQWQSDKETFEFQTSGSTGAPKKILLTREQLSYSANSTIQFLFNSRLIHKLLLCINPAVIGGTQVLVRGLVTNSDIFVVPPSSSMSALFSGPFDLVSMVPLQVREELKKPNPFQGIATVLIGGADLDATLESELIAITGTRFYHTYGMTETASHIALRKLGTTHFAPLGDIEWELDSRQCLLVKGTVTQHKWIQTNDVVELVKGGFIWKGRADWVINSGGVKIHPEMVEQKIKARFPNVQLLISSNPDDVLGERVVLISTCPLLDQIKKLNILTKYEIPKEEFVVAELPMNAAGKLDRRRFSNSN